MSDRELLLKVENVDLAFPMRTYAESTIKEAVIARLKDPMMLFREQESFYALKNINFEAFAGERIGVLGVNGAGKTTLCRCISGFYTPPNGSITARGKIRALYDSSLGVFPELSGRENLKVLGEIFYDPRHYDLKKIIDESIEFSELGDFIDVPIKAYSKGMQLRLSMSLLSAAPADILILDEVFDGADEFFREKLIKRVKGLIDNSKLVIFVSHHGSQILEVCSRTLLINSGRIVFDGSPADALLMYREQFSNVGHKTFE
jgi:ABC-type polysaccharide/polyol phosphate transport system ATPase subunit